MDCANNCKLYVHNTSNGVRDAGVNCKIGTMTIDICSNTTSATIVIKNSIYTSDGKLVATFKTTYKITPKKPKISRASNAMSYFPQYVTNFNTNYEDGWAILIPPLVIFGAAVAI